MTLFETAEKFFHACESSSGWDVCKEYVAENAKFMAQSEPLTEITTVKGYVDWMEGFGTITAPNSKYEIHASSFDEVRNTVLFFATYTAMHTGDGGPVPPTNQTTNSHYVYAIKMSDYGEIEGMTKIWNSSWALRELGWM